MEQEEKEKEEKEEKVEQEEKEEMELFTSRQFARRMGAGSAKPLLTKVICPP